MKCYPVSKAGHEFLRNAGGVGQQASSLANYIALFFSCFFFVFFSY